MNGMLAVSPIQPREKVTPLLESLSEWLKALTILFGVLGFAVDTADFKPVAAACATAALAAAFAYRLRCDHAREKEQVAVLKKLNLTHISSLHKKNFYHAWHNDIDQFIEVEVREVRGEFRIFGQSLRKE